jgi:hypothetical protein
MPRPVAVIASGRCNDRARRYQLPLLSDDPGRGRRRKAYQRTRSTEDSRIGSSAASGVTLWTRRRTTHLEDVSGGCNTTAATGCGCTYY